MRKYLLTPILVLLCALSAIGQTTITLATGTPVIPAGWTFAGSTSVVGSHVQLTPPAGSVTGRIYTSSPFTMTGCGSFTAEFEFQTIPSSTAWAIADGLAFFIVNPLATFGIGGGIGLPANPNGLVLVLDNYDNDGVANDPLISLYGYPAGFTGTYVEGVATNRIGALNNQHYVRDGSWHHVKVTYAGGNVKVYFNHSVIPGISGYFPIATSGYVGFCAATGGAWSTQSVRNFTMTFDNVSPIYGPDVVCIGSNRTYTDSTAGGTWSSSTPAVATISTAGLLTPLTSGTTTINYTYASGACTVSKVVTVNTSVSLSVTGTSLCSSSTTTLSGPSGGTWSSSAPIVLTVGSSTGEVTPVKAGTAIVTYTHPVGCYDTAHVTIITAPPTLTVSPTPASVCDNGSITLTAAGATTYNLFPPQSWEHGVPTTAAGGSIVDGWSGGGTAGYHWYQTDGATAADPAIGGAHSGTRVAIFNCRSIPSSFQGYLTSPTFNMIGVASATFSIWVYRDVSAFNTGAYDGENVVIGGTDGSSTITIGAIPRRGGAPISGSLTGTSTTTTSGWYQYTYTLSPTFFTGTFCTIFITGNSRNGNNIYIDDITLTATIGPPTWSPTTYLYSDAGHTTAYAGTPLNPVYMHPTGITTPTTITYTASLSNGVCTSTGTSVVTMNPNPAVITGSTITCITGTTTLSSATTGGSWSSSNTAVATIGSSSGTLVGVGVGTATISYCFGGCCTSTVVTVVSSPGAITGISVACLGSTTALSNPVSGGSWSSSNTAVGTVNPSTGIVTGISVGTTVISYGLATCYSTFIVTVNPYPSAIAGALGVCVGATTPLTSSPSGGLWFSSTGVVATVGLLTGVVSGISPGTSIITYRLAGCQVTTTVNVVTTPGPITGTLTTCIGSTTTLSHASAGGTWTSSDVTKATVGASTGIVTGVAIGTARITYAVGTGCFTTSVVTVTAAPPSPTGTLDVCVGNTTTLTHGSPGGTWSGACPAIATVGLGTGIVTAISPGTCIITYTPPSGCLAMATITVNPNTAPITGVLSFCEGGTTTLSTATPGVSWGSSTPSVATIGMLTGVITGISAGTATITCPAIGGCPATAIVTVTPLPTPITGIPTVCEGQTTLLSSATPGGGWSSSLPAVGTVSGAGVVTGIMSGTTIISYTLPTGCYRTIVVTVNPSPAPITGSLGLCVGFTTTLASTTGGGIWTSSLPAATVLSPGLIGGASAGTSVISYTVVSTGCAATATVTVNAVPGAIIGSASVCQGFTTTYTCGTPGGTWGSSTVATGTIDAATGAFTALAPGTTTITYSLGSGCITTLNVTVNSLPGPIGGTTNICVGTTTTLTSAPSGGIIWSGLCPGIATVGVTGSVTGTGAGTCVVSATSSITGCARSVTITVNPQPAVITGITNVCIGQTTTLSSATPGGGWTSSNSNATIHPTTGVVTGAFAGTSIITYTLPGTGCFRTVMVQVNPLPTGIGGSLQVCEGATTALTGTPAGGTWMMSCPTIGTITSGSGIVTGIAPGTCFVTYTLLTGCSISSIVTVNALPGTITGIPSTCIGQTTTLNSTPAGGAWSTTSPNASVHPTTGLVTGIISGTASISYTLTTGCRRSVTVTVFALPGLITGAANVCPGTTTTLNCTPSGGTWTTGCGFASIGVTTGVVTGISAGTCSVTYTAGAGCSRTATVTVNPLPALITGTLSTCSGQCTSLSTMSSGGTWTSSPAGVVSPAGLVCPTVPGTVTVTYTMPTGCRTTAEVTVYATPGTITGGAGAPLTACEGQCTPFSTTTPGGGWVSSNPAVGTIDATSGMFCGLTSGTTSITYTLGTGCNATATVTVNAVPLPVAGASATCIGQCASLSNSSPGGTWSSGTTATGTISAGGVFCGVSSGTSTVSYTLTNGCAATQVMTVNALPTIITGPTEVCEQADITLASTPLSGVWSSGTPLLGTIDATTGVFTGLSAGTALVSYTAGMSCVRTTNVTVHPQPAAISGNRNVCIGGTSTLATTSTGGVWSSSDPSVAPVDASGVVSGLTLGTAYISYTYSTTGCPAVVMVTVQPLPAPITGSDGFCNLSTTFYASASPGGTWTSTNPAILTIDPVSGMATGVTVDTTDIIYTLPTGCTTSKRVFLILAPYPISGLANLCLGQCTMLSNVIGGGVWSSSNPAVAPIAPTGLVCGLSLGTASITYVLSTGCASAHGVTVNPVPVGILGPNQVCEGSNIVVTNPTPGGTWSSSSSAIASISGIVAGGCVVEGHFGGTAIITYTLGTGCSVTKVVTVNSLPDVITGTLQGCEGLSGLAVSGPSGGIWSSADPAVAHIDAGTGIITWMSAMTPGVGGLGRTVVTYTLPTSCLRTQAVTVNPLPDPIYGSMNVCVGDMTLLGNATPGGGWISSNPAVGTIDGVTGIFTGISAGTTIVSYMLPTACVATFPMQVHANPAPITGSLSVCAGFSTNLISGPSGGVWTQDPSSMVYGTINGITGVVSGIIAGVIPVTYTMGSGCRVTDAVTVVTLPAVIGGPPQVCVDDSVSLTNPVLGGAWTSSNPARATVNSVTGMVHGISAGPVVITYTVGTGCFNILNMTVNPLPLPITGPLQVCEGSTIVLSSGPTPGGHWISDITARATVGYMSGIVTGILAGVANISYALAPSGCIRAVQVTINPTPPAITGNPHVCIGASGAFSNTMPGGEWYSSNPAIATIGLTTGIVTSVTTGPVTITYQIPATGCMATLQITVQPLPNVYNVTGGGSYCSGGNGVTIGLDGSQPGVSYVLYRGPSATGYLSGTGFPLDFDLHTAAGVYTVQATNVTSSCVRNMAGSATVSIIPLVTPAVTIALTPYDSVCPGQSMTMVPVPVNGGTTPTYVWQVNGVDVSTGASYSFVPANGDIATVIMTSNASCKAVPTATANRTLTVLPNAMPVADVLTTPNDTICQFNPVTFTAAPTYGGPSPAYTWMVNGVVAGTGASYSYIPVNGDVVKLSMTSDYRCRIATNVTSGDVNMSVDSMLIPTVSVSPAPGFMVESGKPVTLYTAVTNGGANPQYQWKVNGHAVPGATLATYTAVFRDYDSVSCEIRSGGVCNNIGTSDWVFITVTPTGTQLPMGIASDIRLIPNPNKGMFSVKGTLGSKLDGDAQVEVTDMLGQVVYRGVTTAKQGRLDAQVQLDNTLANGMYILTLRAEQEQKVFHFVLEQ